MGINGFLLDTTVLIDLFRGRREIIGFMDKLAQDGDLFICSIPVTEVFSGVRPQELPGVEEFFEAVNYLAIEYRTAKRAGLYRQDF